MKTRPSKLDDILDRVPVARLQAAIARRRDRRRAAIARRRDRLSDHLMAQFDSVLRRVAAKHRVPPGRLLSADRDAHAVAARWALYAALHCLGWSVLTIADATGHDRTRIYHGLRRRGHLPPAHSHAHD